MMNPAAARILDSSFGGASAASNHSVPQALPQFFPGLARLHQECCRVYPTQPNPLQLKSRVKFWAGGPDPLDYISIFSNSGTPDGEIPPHWHYVSFGLTDLYGDGRIYPMKFPPNEGNSGFGFELTFRLKKDTANPPVWPGILLQQLATYAFQSGNPFLSGDHISWHKSLEENEESRLQHLLVTTDSELRDVDGPFGVVKFMQLVGCMTEELEAVQHWHGLGLLELMKANQDCGGRYLITDLRRGESIFELDPNVQEKVTEGIAKDGSTLSGVTTKMVAWTDVFPLQSEAPLIRNTTEIQRQTNSGSDSSHGSSNNNLLGPSHDLGQSELNTPPWDPKLDEFDDGFEQLRRLDLGEGDESVGATALEPSMSSRSQHNENAQFRSESEHEDLALALPEGFGAYGQDLSMSIESNKSNKLVDELIDETVIHESIRLTLDLEAALLIPLAIKGRIRHGRHFTFKSKYNDCAVTIVAPYVTGSYADMTNKFASRANWLQICLDDELADKLLEDFDNLKKSKTAAFPITIYSLDNQFALTVTV